MATIDQLWLFLARALGTAIGSVIAIGVIGLWFTRGRRRERRRAYWRRRRDRDDDDD